MSDRRLHSHHARHLIVALFVTIALAVALFPAAASAAEHPPGLAKKLAHPHAKDRVIVGYEPGASKAKRARSVQSVDVASVERISPNAKDTVVVELQPGQTVADAIIDISAQPGVAYVEPNYRVYPAATSNDPGYTNGNLWGMRGDGTSPPNQYGTGAGEAWAWGFTGSQDVYVAVIDQGVQISHPDLEENIWTNPGEIAGNGIDDDGNGFDDDLHGWDFTGNDATVYDSAADDWHGTHVAGTIGARGGNGIGVAGVDWDVTIIPVKFMDQAGGYVADAVKAIDYITDLKRRGVNVVATNNSWEGGGFSQALNDAIDEAGDEGILFVAAAGNAPSSGTPVDIDVDPVYPAVLECDNGGTRGWDCLISVANLTSAGALASTSNWGDQNVDLGAPGSGIYSTYPESGYEYLSGTSMAAPHVTGAIALCASIDPSLTANQIRSRIMASAASTTSMTGKTVTGGRLDIGALVAQCGRTVPPIVGLTAAAADQTITNADLPKGSVDSQYSDSVPAGEVIGQTPAAGTIVAPGSAVDYVVSLGKPTVPDLAGLSTTAADAALTAVTLTTGDTSNEYDDSVAAGLVIGSTPTAGATVSTGSAVDYVVSLGQPTVPALAGLTTIAADAALTAVTLTRGSVTSAHHGSIAAGLVIGSTPTAGATVSTGSAVDYVVSLGPIDAPDIVGDDKDAAASDITAAGLTGAPSTAYDDDVAADLVISQDPAPGTDLGPGDPLSYVVSLGKVPVSVPALVGLTAAAADQAIGDAGLTRGTVGSEYSVTIPAGHVIRQAPAAGAPAALGTPVGYDLSLGVEPVAAPTPAPVVPTVVVDERSPWFVRRGAGWKRAIGGYRNRYLWAPTRAASAARSGRWQPVLPAVGDYRIEVKIPPRHATTRKATYKVRTTSGWVKRVRDQRTSRGRWISLGVHRLTTRPVVLLTDRTGERASLRRRVGFDAVRFIPVVPGAASTSVVTPSSDGASADGAPVQPAAQPSPVPTPAPTNDPTAPAAVDPDATPEPTVEATPPAMSPPATATPSTGPAATPETNQAEPVPPEPTPEPTIAAARASASEQPKTNPAEPTAERTAVPASEPGPETRPSRQTDPSGAPPKQPTAEQDSKSAERPVPRAERPKAATERPDPPQSRPDATEPPQKPAIEKRESEPKPAGPSKVLPEKTAATVPELVLVIDPERLVLTVGETRPLVAYACPNGAAGPGADEKYGTADDACSTRENVEWSLKDPDVADIVEAEGKRTRLSATQAIAVTKVIAKAGDLTAKGELKIKPAVTPEPAPTVETAASQPRSQADPAAKADPRQSADHLVQPETRPKAGTSSEARPDPESARPAGAPPSQEPVPKSTAEASPSMEPTPEPAPDTGEPAA